MRCRRRRRSSSSSSSSYFNGSFVGTTVTVYDIDYPCNVGVAVTN